MNADNEPIRLVDREIDLRTGQVQIGARRVRLTGTEVALLTYLAAHSGEPISRYTLLDEVWGYGQQVLSRAVDTAVRRLRAKIEADPKNPVHLLTEYGFGYRFVPLRPRVPETAPFPRRADRFFGRQADRSRTIDRLREGLVTLVGPAGIGKTRLAEEVGRQWQAGGPAWFTSLGPATAATLVRAVAEAVDVPADGPDPIARIGWALADRGTGLVVLDNAERLRAPLRDLLAIWRDAAPRIAWLVTSRVPLEVPGEQVLDVGPLPLSDAVALLVDRIRSAGAPEPDVDDPVLADLAARLDALPLALELAAARTRVLSVRQVRDRLAERLDLLADRRPGAPRHHATLRTALDESWALLDEPERDAFAACAVFSGPFVAEAAEAILPAAPDRPALALVEALVDQSLLRVAGAPTATGERALVLLENLHAYAAERLHERGEAAARDRHRDWFAAWAEHQAAAAERAGGLLALRRVGEALPDLLAAHAHAVETAPETAARLALALEAVFHERGPHQVHVAVLDRTLAVAGDLPAAPRSRLHRARADALRLGGRREEAAVDAKQALDLAERAGEATVLGRACCSLALLSSDAGATREALALLERATRLGREAGDRWLQAYAASQRGAVYMDCGEPALGERFCLEALDGFRAVGDERRVGGTLTNLGNTLLVQGRADEALQHFREALDLAERAGARRKTAVLHVCLGNVAAWQERPREAETHYRAAARGYRAVGLAREEAIAVGNLGWTLVGAERYEEGEAALWAARDGYRRQGTPRNEALALGNLGVLAHLRDDPHRAVERLRGAIDFAHAGADRRAAAYFLAHLGAAAAEIGDAGARDALAEARESAAGVADPDLVLLLDLCDAIADLALAPGAASRARAERALAATDAARGPHLRVAKRLLARRLA